MLLIDIRLTNETYETGYMECRQMCIDLQIPKNEELLATRMHNQESLVITSQEKSIHFLKKYVRAAS